jgi:voltage-gated potassium channel
MSIRRRSFELLEAAQPEDSASRAVDLAIMSLIALSILALILESMAPLQAGFGGWFWGFEVLAVAVFTMEYLLRLWSAPEDPEYRGRLRFALRPIVLIDLLAILPFYLIFFPADLRFLRALRLFRIFRLGKLGRYSRAMQSLRVGFDSRKEELVLSGFAMLMLIVMASSALYYVEHPHQPEDFSSIPATMWWGVATLTTVGYGDVTPITGLGKALGSVVAILGIGMFAVPTGILGAAFSEAMQAKKDSREEE